MFISKSILVH